MTHLTLVEAEQRFIRAKERLQFSPKTLTHYRSTFKDLHRFLAEAQIAPATTSLTTETCGDFALWLQHTPIKPYRGSTVRSAHGLHGRMKDLRAFVGWLHDEGYLDGICDVPVPKQPQRFFRILTEAEQITLFTCPHLTGDGPGAKRNLAIFLLFLDTGARLAELANATLDDLYLHSLQLKVVGKGNQARVVFYSEITADALKVWLKIRGNDAGPIFDLSYDGMKSLFGRVKRATGLEHLHPHALRHLAATSMVRRGMDLNTLQNVLGHRQLSTVQIYLSLSKEDMQKKHAAASPVASLQAVLPETPKPKRRKYLPLKKAS